MRLLLDEDVAVPLVDLIRHLLREHTVDHVTSVGWRGKKDRPLFRDAAGRFDAVLTNNIRQFNDPDECRAIQRSRLHHISYEQGDGLDGLGLGRDLRGYPAGDHRAECDGQPADRAHSSGCRRSQTVRSDQPRH